MDAPADIDLLLTALDEDEWFSSCAAELKQALVRDARPHRLAAGEALYRDGESARHALFCVVEGAIRLSSSLHDGTPSLLVYLEPFHWFGDISLIDGRPYIRDAIADVDTHVLCVPMQPFTQWLDQNPKYWRDIARLSINAALAKLEKLGLLSQGYKSIELINLANLLNHANHLDMDDQSERP